MKRSSKFFLVLLIAPLALASCGVVDASNESNQLDSTSLAQTSTNPEDFPVKENKVDDGEKYSSFEGVIVYPPMLDGCGETASSTYKVPIAFVARTQAGISRSIRPGDFVDGKKLVFNGRQGFDAGRVKFANSLIQTTSPVVYHDETHNYCAACGGGTQCRPSNPSKDNSIQMCSRPTGFNFDPATIKFEGGERKKAAITLLLDASGSAGYAETYDAEFAGKPPGYKLANLNILTSLQQTFAGTGYTSDDVSRAYTFGSNATVTRLGESDQSATFLPGYQGLAKGEKQSLSISGTSGRSNLYGAIAQVAATYDKDEATKDAERILVVVTTTPNIDKTVGLELLQKKLDELENKVRVFIVHVDSPLVKVADPTADFDETVKEAKVKAVDPVEATAKDCNSSADCPEGLECRPRLGEADTEPKRCYAKYDKNTRVVGPLSELAAFACKNGGAYFYTNNYRDAFEHIYTLPYILGGSHVVTSTLENSSSLPEGLYRLSGQLFFSNNGLTHDIQFTGPNTSSAIPKVLGDKRFIIQKK